MDNSAHTNPQIERLALIADPELRRELEQNVAPNDFTGAIRTAFVLLERRIRESAGLGEHLHCKELIDKAFNPKDGILQPVSPDGGERNGLYSLLLGIFLYYRNPIAHRPVQHAPDSALAILFLIDHAIRLVREAVELSFNLDNIVGAHEGQIRRRRDYRLDIDGDGELEVVVLLSDEGELKQHLLPLILKKDDKGNYRRIPTERVRGLTLYGPGSVVLRHVTSTERPDIEVSWTMGNSQFLSLILRRQGDRYVIAEREIPEGLKNPYSGPSKRSFPLHSRQLVDFADVDGDGLDEIIERLSFDSEYLKAMGVPERPKDPNEHVLVSRLWKWDAEKELIVLVEEGLIVQRYGLRSPLP